MSDKQLREALDSLNKAFRCAYIECPAHVVDDLKRRFDDYLAALAASQPGAQPYENFPNEAEQAFMAKARPAQEQPQATFNSVWAEYVEAECDCNGEDKSSCEFHEKLEAKIQQASVSGYVGNIGKLRAARQIAFEQGAYAQQVQAGSAPDMQGANAEELAQRFHEAYERLAPDFGYTTRKSTAVPWEQVPEQNKRLMIAVCAELLAAQPASPGEAMKNGQHRIDWRQTAWHVGVRQRNGKEKIWTITSPEWFSRRKDCAEYIKNEIASVNWETYEYKPVKCVMVHP